MRAWFRFMDWPLRAKMATLLVAASLLPLGIETFVNIRETRDRLMTNTADLLAARGDHLADRIDTFHRGYAHSAGRISRLPDAAALCQARSEEIERFKGSLRAILEVWPASDANICGVAILDLSGTVRVATEEALIGLDLSYHGHVREALRGASITSDIYLAEPQVAFEPRIAYLDPVRGADGKTAGTAVLWVRASALWDVMKASNELAGAGSFAVLFDQQGVRIGHTFSEDMIFHPGGRLDAATVEALVAERRFGEKTRRLLEDVRPFPEQFDRARSEAPDRGLFRGFAPVNQKWNYGVARRFATVSWTVFYMIPEQALNAQIAQMTREKIVFAGVILLTALIAGTLLASVILKPIDSLSRATELIAGGNLTARVPPGHSDELGQLGRSFNSMAERIETQATSLEKARDEMELRVQERTAELAQTNRSLEVEITERKEAEEALCETQSRLHSTLAAGSIGTWTWDIVHDRLAADEFTARMFSIEPDAAAKGLPAGDYLKAVMEEDQPGVADGLARAIQTCGYYDVEYRVRQKDRELRWLQAKGRVEGDAAGIALNFHGAVMDITERKRTEERFRRLVDSNAQGVIFWNTKGEITRANDAFLRIVGYTREDLEAGRVGWASMTPPEFAHLDQRSLEELAARGVCTPFEKEYLRKDGSRVPILIGAATFEDSPDEGVCFVLDITEGKQTDQALRESEERFRFLNNLSEATRTLADPAQIMAVTARMLGEHLHASRCAYADVEQDGDQFTILHDYTDGCTSTVGNYQLSLFGARAVATLQSGQTLVIRSVEAELLPGEGADMFKAIGIKAIITCPLVKEGGLRAMMAVHQASPRDWKPGEIAMVQDVVERCWATIERRTAEEKIHQLNSGLEQRVIERTAQLESANKELEAFSYSVSHDLRAPLRGVDGYVRMLKEDCGDRLDAEGNRLLDVVSSEAKRMGQLIDDLLAFSRLGREQMESTAIDMTTLARAAFESPSRTDPASTPRFELKSLPLAQGDLSMLRQVFVNLIGNAVKFTRHQSAPVVEVGSRSGDGETTYYVRDNGVGFDEKYGHKLFGVFQRLHSEDEFEGTGVGLALVQRVIQRHGGKVWAEGKPDQGATFYFSLPTKNQHSNEH